MSSPGTPTPAQQAAATATPEVAETEVSLCDRSQVEAPSGDLEQTVDVDGDGTPEQLSIEFKKSDPGGEATLALSTTDPSTGSFEVVGQHSFSAMLLGGQTGPYSSAWYGDLTGDAQNEVVLCFWEWGANDPFTSVVIFSYDGVSAETLFEMGHQPHVALASTGTGLSLSVTYDWFAGSCRETTTSRHQWDGSGFAFVGEDKTVQSPAGVDCSRDQ